MIFQFKVQETSTTYVNVEASDNKEAYRAFDAWSDIPANEDKLSDWLDRGYEGRTLDIVALSDDEEEAPPDIYASRVLNN